MRSNRYPWYLCGVTDAAGPPSVIHINDSRFVIGRRPGVNLKLNSRFISGQHVELTMRDDRLFATDLGSRNGMYINGERVRGGQLGLGDVLTLGDIHFRIRRQYDEDELRDGDDSVADLHIEWLGGQLDQLLEQQSAFPVLSPVYGLREDAIVGYHVAAGSNVVGLETEAKILQAATWLGRESDVHHSLLTWTGSAAERIEPGRWLCLRAPRAVNTELELLPALKSLRSHSPEAAIIVAFSDLPGRSLRALKHLAAVFQQLSIDLGMRGFEWEQQRFIQTANLKLNYVRLDGSLAGALFGDSEAHRTRVRVLADALHERRIRLAVGNVATEAQLDICRELGVDFADGPFLADPQPSSQPFPETGILTSSHVARMFAAETQLTESAASDSSTI